MREREMSRIGTEIKDRERVEEIAMTIIRRRKREDRRAVRDSAYGGAIRTDLENNTTSHRMSNHACDRSILESLQRGVIPWQA